jgi:hypothetical protein
VPVVTPDDVRTLQGAIAAEVSNLGDAVARAVPPLDDVTYSQWRALRVRALNFVGQSPGWLHAAAQMNAGEQLQRELYPWHARLAAQGVKDVPPAPPPPPASSDLFGTLGKAIDVVPFLLILLAFREWKGTTSRR